MSQDLNQGHQSWRQQAVAANVHRACPHCQAPGVWTAQDKIKASWPGCYVEAGDALEGEGVGSRCPNCSRSREATLVEALGEIWRKIW